MKNLYQHALQLLAIREHSRFELKQKLAKYCSDQNTLETTLDQLEQAKALSDTRFTEAFIHAKKNRGYGPNYIRQQLLQRRVDKSLIENALIQIDDWEQTANRILKKKFGDSISKDLADKLKRRRYLLQRGFSALGNIQKLSE